MRNYCGVPRKPLPNIVSSLYLSTDFGKLRNYNTAQDATLRLWNFLIFTSAKIRGGELFSQDCLVRLNSIFSR